MVGCAIASSTREGTSLGPGPSKTRWGTRREFIKLIVIQGDESVQMKRTCCDDFGWNDALESKRDGIIASVVAKENMAVVTLEEAQARLVDLVHRLAPGEEVVITENDAPVARLVPAREQNRKVRRLGTLHGTVLHVADDFDAPLDDFAEYSR